ncbi:PIN domain-containing protein [candidate division KSB1 bacterium]|nr:PIN domain-containing protein [candidate division KSB1 bacterium]RQW04443.1 MAG: PIN domain-containing protein [candidate division KSB1 bacterium]
MIALDTNIIIRFLVQDDPAQCKIVDRLFERAVKSGDKLWISNFVILEMIWVLERIFSVTRHDIINTIESLSCLPILAFEDSVMLMTFCQMALTTQQELDDLLIGLKGQIHCDYTFTFDKKAAKCNLFKLLK